MLGDPSATDWWSVYVLHPFPYSHRALVSCTLVLSMLVGYWGSNAVLSVIYYFNLFPQWKIQGAKWPERKLWVSAILNELGGTCVLQPLVGYFILGPVLSEKYVTAAVPDLFTFVWQIAVCFIIADGVFYWTHRLLHTERFYKYHKQHHSFKQTVGFALSYAHPVEALVSNLPSTALGPILLRPHLTVMFVYLVLRYQESAEEHSGYLFPYSPWALLRSNEHHDFHHSHNIGAYGTFPFWDWFCGTDKAFNDFKAKQARAGAVSVKTSAEDETPPVKAD